MLVNISTLLLQFEKCIVNDICDAGSAFFHFPPAGSTNKRVGKVCLTFLPNFQCFHLIYLVFQCNKQLKLCVKFEGVFFLSVIFSY